MNLPLRAFFQGYDWSEQLVNFSDQFTESEWLKFSYKLWLMFKNAYISTYLEVNLDVQVCGLQC